MTTAEAVFNNRIKSDEWSRFWARANELGWKKEEVHTHFGLESMKEFSGTLDDALAMLETPVPDELAPGIGANGIEADDFPPEDTTYVPDPPASNTIAPVAAWYGDAPLSVCINTYGPGGFDVQFTMRDTETETFTRRVTGLLGWLSKNGYRPKFGNGNNGRKPQAAQNAQTNGDAPTCNLHNKPMKRSQHFAGWYCTAKLADDTYCKEQVRDD